MIYTATLNPALDRVLWVDKIRESMPNRILDEAKYAGGKGIDVSRALSNLGIGNCALGFTGGPAGKELERQLNEKGIVTCFIEIAEETRTNIIINEASTGRQILFNARGPCIESQDLERLIRSIKDLDQPEVITIGGSLPPGVPPSAYSDIIKIAKAKGAKVILDVEGEALREGIMAKPDIIKPNIHELSDLIGYELRDMDEILAAARDIHKRGVEVVLVSMDSKGIILVADGEESMAVPPEVQVRNTIGAGDSAVAGFIYGMVNGSSLKESLIYAVAAGTATTLSASASLCKKDDFIDLLSQIRLNVIQDNIVGVCQPKPVK